MGESGQPERPQFQGRPQRTPWTPDQRTAANWAANEISEGRNPMRPAESTPAITTPAQVETPTVTQVAPAPDRAAQEAAGAAQAAAIEAQQTATQTETEGGPKGVLARALDKVLDKMTDVGVPVLKITGGVVSGLAEFFGPTTMWVPKVALVAGGFGLEKLGNRHPNSRVCRLAKALGSGTWKGGMFGLVSNLLVNAVMPAAEVIGPAGVSHIPATEGLSMQMEQFASNTALGAAALRVKIATQGLGQAVGLGNPNLTPAINQAQNTLANTFPGGGVQVDNMIHAGSQILSGAQTETAKVLATPAGRVAGAAGITGVLYGIGRRLGIIGGGKQPQGQ